VFGQDDVSLNRGDKLNELWLHLLGHSEDHLFTKPKGSSAARSWSSSPQSGPDNGWTDVMQLLPCILEEMSQVSSPDHASLTHTDRKKPGNRTGL
jgi:hypothetical protein